MRSYTHIAGAILFYLIFAFLLDLNNLLVGLFFAGWISVFPDIIDKLLGEHRGLGHSIFWLIPFVLIGFWNLGIAAAIIIGFLSHIFLDTLTTHGSPVLYPLWKTTFVCLSERRRVKTGTNYDKAVFLFILLLITPLLLYAVGASLKVTTGQDPILGFGTGVVSTNTPNTNDTTKSNFNLNFQLNQEGNKDITIQKVSENETKVMVRDI